MSEMYRNTVIHKLEKRVTEDFRIVGYHDINMWSWVIRNNAIFTNGKV